MAYTRGIALENLVSTITEEIAELQRGMAHQVHVNEEQGRVIAELQRGMAHQVHVNEELQRGMAEQVSITRSFQTALERLMPLQ